MKTIPSPWAPILLGLGLAVFAGACGDDDDDDNPDATTSTVDAAARPDATTIGMDALADAGMTQPDATPQGDSGVSGTAFTADLSGAQEVPVARNGFSGSFEATLDGTTLTYRLRHDVTGANAAHIHRNIAGANGPVVIPFPGADPDQSGTFQLTPDLVNELEAGRLYVNVHSPQFPNGAVRGQIILPTEDLFVAHLSGRQEVPPVTTTSTGAAQILLDRGAGTVRYLLATSANSVAQHIHRGIAGVNGPVLVPLDRNGGTAALAALDMLATGDLYVNVHTAANPGGELRGQIVRPGTQVFAGHLTPSQEVPPAVGALSEGRAQTLLNYARDEAVIRAIHTATLTAAHVHLAPGGTTGPVLIPLPTANDITETEAVTATRAGQLERGLWYVNVHTAAFPNGEIRGQLIPVGARLYTATLSGANEVPPVVTNATGGSQLVLHEDGTSWHLEGTFSGIATPTAAHIHRGAPLMSGPVVFPLTLTGDRLTGMGMLSPAERTDLDASLLYVNLHSMMFPNGEIRGQLTPQP